MVESCPAQQVSLMHKKNVIQLPRLKVEAEFETFDHSVGQTVKSGQITVKSKVCCGCLWIQAPHFANHEFFFPSSGSFPSPLEE